MLRLYFKNAARTDRIRTHTITVAITVYILKHSIYLHVHAHHKLLLTVVEVTQCFHRVEIRKYDHADERSTARDAGTCT